jgi:5-methylcytosine-specific restriction endonuclease McrA
MSMTTVILGGGGGGFTHHQQTRHRRLKGYAKSRQDYDARRRKTPKSEATKAFMAILRADVCAFCKAAPDVNSKGVSDRDHITPLSLGGLDNWENMTAACASCNRGRRDLPVLQFLLRRAHAV